MKKLATFLFLIAIACAPLSGALAAPAAYPASQATPDPSASLVYDDAAMHFVAPNGFVRMQGAAPQLSDKLTPVAVFVKNPNSENRLVVIIAMEEFGGSLGGWESNLENEIRTQIDGAFIKAQRGERLPNGMPGYWMKVSFGEGFSSSRQFGYATFDGRRGIYIYVAGRLGEVDDTIAKDVLKDLSVVVYPYGR